MAPSVETSFSVSWEGAHVGGSDEVAALVVVGAAAAVVVALAAEVGDELECRPPQATRASAQANRSTGRIVISTIGGGSDLSFGAAMADSIVSGAPVQARYGREVKTLGHALREFRHKQSPRVIASAIVGLA